jgi:hypothetical protein
VPPIIEAWKSGIWVARNNLWRKNKSAETLLVWVLFWGVQHSVSGNDTGMGPSLGLEIVFFVMAALFAVCRMFHKWIGG